MKSELTKNPDTGDPVSDGDGNGGGGGAAGGNSQRAALGEIAKIKQIAEILENIVLPTIVDSAQANKAAGSPVDHQSDPIKIIPKGLKLLQHHSAITSNIDDGSQAATNQKPNPQSVDN